MRGGALLDPILTNKEELVGNVKVREVLPAVMMTWWSSESCKEGTRKTKHDHDSGLQESGL